MQKIVTHLAFKSDAEGAVDFYTSVLPDSRITGLTRFRADDEHGQEGSVQTIRFELLGQKFLAVNGGEEFSFAEGTSLLVPCETQEEIDAVWDAFMAEGATPQACGWLTDRWGLTWQIVAAVTEEYLYGDDAEASGRVLDATYGMVKIDLAETERAFRGR
ncbi:VOC family protein [Amycolatopsis sp. CA-230715]|uniref:VOC family protein n=1 Tax=Amycolatopsis sp. CA-230715 TaxID=2745196 RepID=UPI001C0119D8|nr:VOC family protein [Amycolatopsis sp. CA-230715]QWF79692.1 hypothetical protein HUW46_03101 [Amycolatopsis sp. CA-230715]